MPEQLREYRMKFERVPDGDNAVPDPTLHGVRSKLGGAPDWEQGDAFPECPSCGEKMTFVAQIDSIEHKAAHNPHQMPYKEQQYMFGDVGMIYVFCCLSCNETSSVMQFG